MKKIILSILASALWINGYSQRTCGSELNMEQVRRTEPLKYQRITDWENQIKLHSRSVPSSTILIPVVVHVVYNNAAQNISDAQIISQIQVLNEDFRRMNADQANTPSAFANLAGNANIEFKLARRDPNGNTTNGITRTSTSTETFSMEMDNVKFSNLGGNNAWNTRRYLNIWVCNLGDDLLGYAQFPFEFQTKPNTDGVVIHYKHFGRDGSAESPYDKGRTATHEVGHWLDLRHIWGDDGGSCSGTDNIADTPNQGGYNEGCPSFPKTDHCTNTSPGVMFMNYMDYTYDACMNLFTKGQVERMRSLFDTQTGIRREMQIYANELTNPLSFSITGPSEFCDNAIYKIANLPTGTTVQWSTSMSGNPYPLIANNSPQTNQCTLYNVYNCSADIFILAKIYQGASHMVTLSKKIIVKDNSTVQKGRYVQEECTFYGVHHPSITGELIDGANFLYQGCMTRIYLDNMYRKTIEFTGSIPPLYWYYVESQKMLLLQLPLGSGGIPFTYKVKGGCQEKTLLFFSRTGNRNVIFTLSPNPATDAVTLQLTETDEVSGLSVLSTERSAYEIQIWSGMRMLRSFRTNEPTFQIPMAGLPAGLYFVRVVKNGQTYTQKLIKK